METFLLCALLVVSGVVFFFLMREDIAIRTGNGIKKEADRPTIVNITFKNPSNGYQETIGQVLPRLGVFLLGPIYLICCGLWTDVIAYVALVFVFFLLHPAAGVVVGIFLNFICFFIIRGMLKRNYLKRGWVLVDAAAPSKEGARVE